MLHVKLLLYSCPYLFKFFKSCCYDLITIQSYYISDKFGNTPLFEAVKKGNDRVASILVKEGASLNIVDAGGCLCQAVARGDSDFIKRLLSYGLDPNSKDYDQRTALHLAVSEELYLMTKLLIEAGASVLARDRYKLNFQLVKMNMVTCLSFWPF